MAKYKYQLSTFNLFDYAGVERHLEKMAAKGWQFDSIGSFAWKYKKAEPAHLKYSVTYIPEASDFDPLPLEKQKGIEEYCEEAGWKKAGNWLQMQIFCSENPNAVPIETDEEMRLTFIGKSMKKNFLFSHTLLMFVFLLNAVTMFTTATNNWPEFLSDSSRLWNCGLWIWGILLLLLDIVYYVVWMHRARNAVEEGRTCPEPKVYRIWNRVAWVVLLILLFGMFSSYTSGMIWFMVVYMTGIFLVIFGVRKVQKKLKEKGVSKKGNWVLTLCLCVFLSFLLVGGLTALVFSFDIRLTKERTPEDIILVNGREWETYQDTLPLYVKDFADTDFNNSSREAREKSSFLVGYGEYREYLFEGKENTSVTVANRYEVITAKVEFLYDFLLKAFYEREFRHWDDAEREKIEYRIAYECDAGTMYRQYYEGLPMAHDWLVLTSNKIVPMTLFLEDLTAEQMKIIVEAFGNE